MGYEHRSDSQQMDDRNDPKRALRATEAQTPPAWWRADGHADPHGTRYDCTREQLAGGHMSDDEVANAVYLDPGINNLTIAKDRIRWLSRQLAGEIRRR